MTPIIPTYHIYVTTQVNRVRILSALTWVTYGHRRIKKRRLTIGPDVGCSGLGLVAPCI
ncbi:hypothetical protein Hanom_Chr17g01559951 [Helianthus anomalus]